MMNVFFEGVPVGEKNEEIVGPRKNGVVKGIPLDGVLPTFSPRKKSVAEGKTSFQTDAFPLPHRGTQIPRQNLTLYENCLFV